MRVNKKKNKKSTLETNWERGEGPVLYGKGKLGTRKKVSIERRMNHK